MWSNTQFKQWCVNHVCTLFSEDFEISVCVSPEIGNILKGNADQTGVPQIQDTLVLETSKEPVETGMGEVHRMAQRM